MFSDILQRFETPLNALYQARQAREARGQKIIDWVSGNLNRAGFTFPEKALQQALLHGLKSSKIYSPHPLGQKPAREALSRYYRTEGLSIPPEQWVLTPGTSLSYLYLFKLLANAGDEILCPTPNYALLDSIAALAGVRLTSYRLQERTRWEINFTDLRAQITARTRAIVLISPHNPTGAVASAEEIAQLTAICREHHLPILSDEVFSPFLYIKGPLPRPATGAAPLVFTLNGLSKMLALAGTKLGWIGVSGEDAAVRKALHGLDMISDTFLPVNEAMQVALPMIFSKGRSFLKTLQKELRQRRDFCIQHLKQMNGISFVAPEGGFYVTIKLLGAQEEEKFALDLLQQQGVLVHPGYFYDIPDSHFVISFVTPPNALQSALNLIKKAL